MSKVTYFRPKKLLALSGKEYAGKNVLVTGGGTGLGKKIATFYSNDVASFLKQRISKEIPAYDNNKLKIRKKSNKEIELISGPYKAINFMKNDYILLKNFGFEELDIVINE